MSEEDLRLLVTLDDPWNAQECDTFNGHQAEHTHTHSHGQTEPAGGDRSIERPRGRGIQPYDTAGGVEWRKAWPIA